MPNGLSILYVLTLVVLGGRHGKCILMDALREVFTTCMGGLPGLAFLPTPILIDMVAVPPYADSPVASVLDEEPGRTLKDIIIDSGCKVLAELSDAETSGDEKAPARTTFSRRHSVLFPVSNASFQNGFWLRKTKKVMKELNAEVPVIPSTAKGAFRFLDLGCCPGGFSAYILEKNKLARSLGISLPVEAGGHSYCLDRRQRRENFLPSDLTRFDLGPSHSISSCEDYKPVPREITNRLFDLAILGATPLSWASAADGHRLLVSQLILGLEGVKTGGSLIVTLSNPEAPNTARILYMLDRISRKVSTHKSTIVHQSHGTFFAIALGVGQGKEGHAREAHLKLLRELWVELTVDGGREMRLADLDFIVTVEDLSRTCVAWLVELCGKVWEIQLRALEERMNASQDCSFSSVSSVFDTSFSSIASLG